MAETDSLPLAPQLDTLRSNVTEEKPEPTITSADNDDSDSSSTTACTPSSSSSSSTSPSAPNRFFAIPELVALLLSFCSTIDLLRAQRVSRVWADMIRTSTPLQERLFLQPIGPEAFSSPRRHPSSFNPEIHAMLPPTPTHDTNSNPNPTPNPLHPHDPQANQSIQLPHSDPSSPLPPPPVTLNPILHLFFSPILYTTPSPTTASPWRTYSDLTYLPWARDGTHLLAPSRLAFARREASWRNMLISQPPIRRLDWWHEWDAANDLRHDGNFHGIFAAEIFSNPTDHVRGWGHQDLRDSAVTLGMLWDMLEARLRRGCEARVVYFPCGMAVECDPTQQEMEREWATRPVGRRRGLTADMPRVKVMTRQHWDHTPRRHEGFNLKTSRWERMPLLRRGNFDWDGFNALREDCHADHLDAAGRWSRSEGFAWAEIRGESSGSG